MNFAFKMMDFVVFVLDFPAGLSNLQGFLTPALKVRFHNKDHGFHTKNDWFHTKNDEFRTENDGFHAEK